MDYAPPMPVVYASLPLSGPAGSLGRQVLRGADLALECAAAAGVELIVLDSADPDDREAKAVAHAERAVEDDRALAYLGDFHSSQVMATVPVLGPAGLLQVAPVATFAALRGDTLVRLMPHDGVGARAIAQWLHAQGVKRLLVIHDHDRDYGVAVGAMCVEAAGRRRIQVRSRPVWDHDEPMAEDLKGAQAVLYVGVAGSGAAGLWRDLHAALPETWLLGTEGVAQPWLARELQPGEAARTRFFAAARASFDLYGFEAMSLILDAISQGDDREAVVKAARGTTDRDSVLGRYSIDKDGYTSTTAYGRLAVENAELVWDRG